jgi:hypothetical protein
MYSNIQLVITLTKAVPLLSLLKPLPLQILSLVARMQSKRPE